MLEDTFEGLEDDDVEEAADAEVEKVLWEVTSGKCLTDTPSPVPRLRTCGSGMQLYVYVLLCTPDLEYK